VLLGQEQSLVTAKRIGLQWSFRIQFEGIGMSGLDVGVVEWGLAGHIRIITGDGP